MPLSAKQILSLGHGPLGLLPDSDAVLSLIYRPEGTWGGATDGLSGLGFLLHFDSRQLSWKPNPTQRLFEPGWCGPGPVLIPRAERPEESDGDPNTDQVLRFSYVDPTGRWPGTTLPVPLAELILHARPGFEHTTLRLTALSTPPGATFEAEPLELRHPPRITAVNVSTSQPLPWWKPGDTIDISVQFSDVVQVNGRPTIALMLGRQSRSATYRDGSGSTTLTFRYVVAPGDQGALRLDADAVKLAGATITNGDGLAANLQHGTPTLPRGQADSSAPIVRMDPLAGISRAASLTISGTVTDSGGSGSAAVLLWDGSRSLGEARLSNSRWNLSTGSLAEGVHSFSLQAIDRAGNRSLIQPAIAVTIDRTPPPPPQLVINLGGADQVLTAAAGDAELQGLAEAGCRVRLRLGSLLNDLTTDAQGRFSWSPSQAELRILEQSRAPVSLALMTTDRAGNSTTTTSRTLRLPQAVGSYGLWQVRLGSRDNDSLIGSACSVSGTLRGEAIFGGAGNDHLTGVALRRADGRGWAVPLLSGGRGDDRYGIAEGSFSVIADLGGAGERGGRDSVSLAGVGVNDVALTLIDRSDLLITRRRPAGSDALQPIALLLDALGNRRPEAGNRIESVQLGDTSFQLRNDGALINGQQVLTPRPASYDGSAGLLQPADLLAPALDPQLDLRALVNTLTLGLSDHALIG